MCHSLTAGGLAVNGLGGTLPASLAKAASLRHLDLTNNKFHSRCVVCQGHSKDVRADNQTADELVCCSIPSAWFSSLTNLNNLVCHALTRQAAEAGQFLPLS